MKTNRQLIGFGVLNWNSRERQSDRYGSVCLLDGQGKSIRIVEPRQAAGTLMVKVIEPRRSKHYGDWARGFYPRTPQVDQEFILGTGTVFMEEIAGIFCIGVKPDDGRTHDWLDPKALYNVHESVVELWFEPKEIHA
jgi:hypothetical protein